jgi:peptidyl-prolyl cis-trans isomerase C
MVAVLARAAQAQAPAAAPKPAAVVNGTAITMAEVEAVLKQSGPTPTPLTEVQRRQMQLEAVHMLVDEQLLQQFLRKNGPRVTPAEVNARVNDLVGKLKMDGKTLQDFYKETGQSEAQLRENIVNALQWAGYSGQHLTDADIKRYYDESRDFFDRVAVRASHIVTRVSANAPEAERQTAREKLRALRQQIVSEKLDFAEAAKKHSQDASAANGGDIGYFPRKFAVDESFARAAFALKVGELSDVVQTEYGLHLIKVTDRKPGQPSDFAKIRDEVREFCTEELRLNIVAQQRKTADVKIYVPQ